WCSDGGVAWCWWLLWRGDSGGEVAAMAVGLGMAAAVVVV
nr:hypothetical protein [Tanacetum cinerariifolium]